MFSSVILYVILLKCLQLTVAQTFCTKKQPPLSEDDLSNIYGQGK